LRGVRVDRIPGKPAHALILSCGLLWAIGISRSELRLTELGILSSFSAFFWLALGLATFTYLRMLFNNSVETVLLSILLLILLVSFWFAPLFLGANQPLALHNWAKNASFVAPIVRTGHLDPGSTWYHNWPGTWIVIVAIQEVIGFNGLPGQLTLAPLSALLIQISLSVVLLNFFNAWIGEMRLAYLSLLIFVVANWGLVSGLSPQVFAFLQFVLLISILARHVHGERGTGGASIVTVILLFGIAITHPVTLVFALSTLFGGILLLAATRSIKRGRSFALVSIVLLALVISAGWNLYPAGRWVASHLSGVADASFRMIGFGLFAERLTPAGIPHDRVVLFRVLFSSLWLASGVVGMFLILRDLPSKLRIPTLFMLGVSTGLVSAGLTMSGAVYEAFDRLLPFLMVPFSFFAIQLSLHRITRLALVTLVMLSSPLFFVAHYGDQIADSFQPDYIASVRFFDTRIEGGTITGWLAEVFSPFASLSRPGSFDWLSFSEIRAIASKRPAGAIRKPHYVLMTSTDRNASEFLGLEADDRRFVANWLDQRREYGAVYDTSGVRIYVGEWTGPPL
jgi:hypothetical protein